MIKRLENLDKVSSTLKENYDTLYDINLQIYRAKKNLTIVDIRYYPKSSLNKDYRETIKENQPMLHCKVPMPPWLSGKKEKFDINWQHYKELNKWKLLLFKLKGRQFNKKNYASNRLDKY